MKGTKKVNDTEKKNHWTKINETKKNETERNWLKANRICQYWNKQSHDRWMATPLWTLIFADGQYPAQVQVQAKCEARRAPLRERARAQALLDDSSSVQIANSTTVIGYLAKRKWEECECVEYGVFFILLLLLLFVMLLLLLFGY